MSTDLTRRVLLAVVFAAVVGLVACGDQGGAADPATSEITVSAAVVTTGVDHAAAYAVIHNAGDGDDRLLGARLSDAGEPARAEAVSLHETVERDGLMEMHHRDAVDVPAGGDVVLEPGGLHVMLEGLSSPITSGEELALVLEFETAGEVEVTARAVDPGEVGDHVHASHDHAAQDETAHDHTAHDEQEEEPTP